MPSAFVAVVTLGLVAPAAALRVAAVRPALCTRTVSTVSTIRMADQNFDFGEPSAAVPSSTTKAMVEEEKELTEREKEIARLRAAEVFMQKETGDAVCGTCGYTYQMAKGAGMTAPPNTPFELLGASWACPKCKSPKAFFTPLTIEIAGFEENQSFGIGTNTWTEGQKSNAIFGGLAFFFALLMSGYALN